MSTLSHFLLASLAAALLAGCAGQPAKTDSAGRLAGDGAAPLPGLTGIARCDDYLSTYRACHRTAGIFTPDQLEAHYRAMRRSLLDQSRNPAVRPLLAARCEVLVRNLREALHGQPCDRPDDAAKSPSLPTR